jgi:hypothetical protein
MTAQAQQLPAVGADDSVASPGHSGATGDRRGRIVEVLGEGAYGIVCWSDGSLSVVPLSVVTFVLSDEDA